MSGDQSLESFSVPETTHDGEYYAGAAALVAAIAAAIGSVIYASKHIKSSSCLGSKCEQQVVVEIPASAQRADLRDGPKHLCQSVADEAGEGEAGTAATTGAGAFSPPVP